MVVLRLDTGECVVRYEAREPQREPHRLALRFGADGSLTNEAPSPAGHLATTNIWRMPRRMPGAGDPHKLLKTLEDTPFYARSMIEATIAAPSTT